MKGNSGVNTERILSLIGEARKAFGMLVSYQKMDDEVLLSDQEKLGNIKYQFIVAIEACIDICSHIAEKTFSEVPESYAHCFDLLKEKGIIESQLAEGMSDFARFRNVLVHLYWKVENKRVIEILKHDLHRIEEFLTAISVFARE
jgi:uncharacterized protein YutE (UPF0331/DUF86 family)